MAMATHMEHSVALPTNWISVTHPYIPIKCRRQELQALGSASGAIIFRSHLLGSPQRVIPKVAVEVAFLLTVNCMIRGTMLEISITDK
jgi:hypothetical protein